MCFIKEKRGRGVIFMWLWSNSNLPKENKIRETRRNRELNRKYAAMNIMIVLRVEHGIYLQIKALSEIRYSTTNKCCIVHIISVKIVISDIFLRNSFASSICPPPNIIIWWKIICFQAKPILIFFKSHPQAPFSSFTCVHHKQDNSVQQTGYVLGRLSFSFGHNTI